MIATDTDNNLSWDIPIVQGFNGSNYYFGTFLLGQAILSFVQKVGENQARWQFIVGQIGADFISYSNDALPNMSTVGEALDELVKSLGILTLIKTFLTSSPIQTENCNIMVPIYPSQKTALSPRSVIPRRQSRQKSPQAQI